jgi:hypothetical protein
MVEIENEYIYCDINLKFTAEGYSKVYLQINDSYGKMVSNRFCKVFNIGETAELKKFIKDYNGEWISKYMIIKFNTMDDVKIFIDDIIVPVMLMNEIRK